MSGHNPAVVYNYSALVNNPFTEYRCKTFDYFVSLDLIYFAEQNGKYFQFFSVLYIKRDFRNLLKSKINFQ